MIAEHDDTHVKAEDATEPDQDGSLGGGSSHDCAKGIGIVASNGGNIRDYEGVDKSQKPMCPMVAINTTAGTASENHPLSVSLQIPAVM